MNWIICLLTVTIFINDSDAVIYYLNDTEYNRMPPVFKLDDYQACLSKTDGLYCTAEFNLVSNTESELLQLIKEYSEQTRTHYNHSQLTHGICVSDRCQNYIKAGSLVERSSLEECLNDIFTKDYKLTTQVKEFTCSRRHESKEEFDTLDKVVAILLIIVLGLNIIGSLYDIRYKNQGTDEGFLLCFSLPRNWKRLTSYASESDPRIERLKSLNGIRCIILIGVVMVHSTWIMIRAGENSHDLELMYYKLRQNFLLSGSLAIQSNIVISGFLLAYNMEVFSETNNINWYIIPKGILLRYLRFTPIYALMVALNASWIKFFERGPLWQVSVHRLLSHCRSDWWRNLLYINNYKYNAACLMPTWYLAVDMQLFCLGIILFVLLRKKTYRKPVLITITLLGMVIIAVHTYVRDLNAIFIISPQECRNLFATDSTFNETYKMGHTNVPSFIIGMMAGYYVYEYQKSGLKVSRSRILQLMYWSLVPVGAVLMFSGEVFYRDASRDPVIVRATYAALSKPLFGALLALLIVGTIFKIENFYRKVLESNLWTIPNRLNFCVFLVNFTLIKLYVGTMQSLVVISNTTMVLLASSALVASFAVAVPLWTLVEMPFARVTKNCHVRFEKKHLKKHKKKNI